MRKCALPCRPFTAPKPFLGLSVPFLSNPQHPDDLFGFARGSVCNEKTSSLLFGAVGVPRARKTVRTFLRPRLWHPFLDKTRSLRHASMREAVTRRYWLDQ